MLAWFAGLEDTQLALSAVTIGEIQAGIDLTRKQDAGKAEAIETWLAAVAMAYNVLPMDAQAFRAWARLMRRRSDTLFEDAMIAATAQIHSLTVVTRNVADFKAFGVPLLNPFDAQTRLRLEAVLFGLAQRRRVRPTPTSTPHTRKQGGRAAERPHGAAAGTYDFPFAGVFPYAALAPALLAFLTSRHPFRKSS